MSFDSIIGQPLAVELGRRWLARQTNHPLLLYGPEGVGKRTLALELAKALNCQRSFPSPHHSEQHLKPQTSNSESQSALRFEVSHLRFEVPHPQGESPPPQSRQRSGESPAVWRPPSLSTRGEDGLKDPCDRCLPCKKISAGKHADVRVLSLSFQAAEREEPLEKQQSLRIETILEERRRLCQTAVESPWKVSLLDEAHRLTTDAANVLLKILEEPPPRTAIFLITNHRDRLLSTLASRCQPIRFRPLTDSEMERRLTEEQIKSADQAEELWRTLPRKTPAEILAGSPARGKSTALDRTDIGERLRHLLGPARQELHAGRPEAAAWVELIQNAQRQLAKNVQPALVYEHALLQLAAMRRGNEQ